MHNFDYKDTPRQLLTPEVINLLTQIHELRGKQTYFLQTEPVVLPTLLYIAKVQSTKASNRIEGIMTSDKRLESIVKDKAEPINRSEEEISGYRDVLVTIHEDYQYIPVRPGTILQFHRDLYAYSSTNVGGNYKNSDNIITETGADGQRIARFIPVPAFQTPQAIEDLCDRFDEAFCDGTYDPLLLIPMFVLDFLCIHPFNDGNGRMSRLLTLLLLYRSGYIVGKYISIEMLIEKSKESYYDALKMSSASWHENSNDYLPFIKYILGVMLKAYSEFEDRVGYVLQATFNKTDRVKAVFDRKVGKITKSEIAELCPDISMITIERALSDLLHENYIEKHGKSRGTFYTKK